jgi:hypothetical protein
VRRRDDIAEPLDNREMLRDAAIVLFTEQDASSAAPMGGGEVNPFSIFTPVRLAKALALLSS